MKRKSLPKSVVITGALLGNILMTTGCTTVQEVIDSYVPSTQQEYEVYGPAQYVENTEEENNKTPENEEEKKESEPEEPEEPEEPKKVKKIYNYDPRVGDATCDYGVIELIEPDSLVDIMTKD